jgi:hypothetical protein
LYSSSSYIFRLLVIVIDFIVLVGSFKVEI